MLIILYFHFQFFSLLFLLWLLLFINIHMLLFVLLDVNQDRKLCTQKTKVKQTGTHRFPNPVVKFFTSKVTFIIFEWCWQMDDDYYYYYPLKRINEWKYEWNIRKVVRFVVRLFLKIGLLLSHFLLKFFFFFSYI